MRRSAATATRAALSLRRLALAAATAVALAGCGMFGGGDEPPPKTLARVSVNAAPTLNPNLNGRPSPVVVRFYQLAAPELFSNADFFQLFEQDTATLGPTSVTKEEHVIEPGQVDILTIGVKDPSVTHLGMVVAFRDYESATWRAIVPIVQDMQSNVALSLLSKNVQAKVDSVGKAPAARLDTTKTEISLLPSPAPSASRDDATGKAGS